jgi:hypothetical protein
MTSDAWEIVRDGIFYVNGRTHLAVRNNGGAELRPSMGTVPISLMQHAMIVAKHLPSGRVALLDAYRWGPDNNRDVDVIYRATEALGLDHEPKENE